LLEDYDNADNRVCRINKLNMGFNENFFNRQN
jgi:hypothetical protein